jgi:hypothetical protein
VIIEMKKFIYKTLITVLLISPFAGDRDLYGSLPHGHIPDVIPYEKLSIKNINGKFYAYVVLLFNENPHFVNLIQKDSIPMKIIGNEGFNIKEYKIYLKTIRRKKLKALADTLLTVYLEPRRYSDLKLASLERLLLDRNIILKFSRDKNPGNRRIVLDYCIYGKKYLIKIKHPLLKIKGKIYNIQPYIYYDEFSTSNSTFYFDMIYINSEEVLNDYLIAKKILEKADVNSMFFVGSRITDDIKYCLIKAFKDKSAIKQKIWEMFVVHELTHKYLNNRYNYYDQVKGEELSLASTIFSNPYLGISVMYSYLNYNSINPHRIAAMNYVKYISESSGDADIVDNPGKIKYMSNEKLKNLSKKYFFKILNNLK